MSVLRVFVLFASLFLSSLVHATDYSWYFNRNVGPYTSALEACTVNGWPEAVNWYYGVATGVCQRQDAGKTGYTQGPNVYRSGDSCPANTTYNSVTGACDAPTNKCSALKDTSKPFTYTSSSDLPVETVNVDGCAATLKQGKCYYQSIGVAKCNGTAVFSGEESTASSSGESTACGDTCPDITLQPETSNKDCVYVTNGNGVSSCSAENYSANPGQAQCGDVNGTFTCVENPKATATKTSTSTTKTPTSNADGTVTVVKDDVVTQTVCKGKSCSTTTTSSSGSVTTDSSGTVVGGSSSCTGSLCNSSGVADGTGDAEEGDGDSPSAGTLTDPVDGSFDGQGDEWDSKIEESKTKLKDGIDKLKDSFKPMEDISLNGGSKLYCPPPVEVLGKSFDICIDKYADSLSWISDAILALCAMVALIIVFS